MSHRFVIRTLAAIAALGSVVVSQDASAQRYSQRELDYYCSLGSQTPRSYLPYCGGRGGGGYGGGHRYAAPPQPRYYEPAPDYGYWSGRRLRQDELAYYCSMGSQTPRSLRGYCSRYGYW